MTEKNPAICGVNPVLFWLGLIGLAVLTPVFIGLEAVLSRWPLAYCMVSALLIGAVLIKIPREQRIDVIREGVRLLLCYIVITGVIVLVAIAPVTLVVSLGEALFPLMVIVLLLAILGVLISIRSILGTKKS